MEFNTIMIVLIILVMAALIFFTFSGKPHLSRFHSMKIFFPLIIW